MVATTKRSLLRRVTDRLLRRQIWDDPTDFEADAELYLKKYAEHGDRGVAMDPKAAIGGHWEEIGNLQFDFLVRRGMKPNHRMLDVGCGTLRGGRLAIRYLEPRHYTGIDISSNALKAALKLVKEEGLTDRQPRLVHNRHRHLKFDQFRGETFDYILAQSVFTHLMPGHIDECFDCVRSVMSPTSAFYFTVWFEDVTERPSPFEYRYPRSLIEELSSKHNLVLEDFGHDYPHPRNQRMMRVMKS
jgi:ubiquinone/menaquinone biosynthesis C-methylase UbiE